jgi:hypothetical protein
MRSDLHRISLISGEALAASRPPQPTALLMAALRTSEPYCSALIASGLMRWRRSLAVSDTLVLNSSTVRVRPARFELLNGPGQASPGLLCLAPELLKRRIDRLLHDRKSLKVITTELRRSPIVPDGPRVRQFSRRPPRWLSMTGVHYLQEDRHRPDPAGSLQASKRQLLQTAPGGIISCE